MLRKEFRLLLVWGLGFGFWRKVCDILHTRYWKNCRNVGKISGTHYSHGDAGTRRGLILLGVPTISRIAWYSRSFTGMTIMTVIALIMIIMMIVAVSMNTINTKAICSLESAPVWETSTV